MKQSHHGTKRTQAKATTEDTEEFYGNWEQHTSAMGSNLNKAQNEEDLKLKSRKFRRRTQRNNYVNDERDSKSDDSEITVHTENTNTTDTAQELREPTTESSPIGSRADPVGVYSGLPAAKFYDTKLYPSHLMSTEEIDQELQNLEAKREENRNKMSDFLADHLKRINGTDYTHILATNRKPINSNSDPILNQNSNQITSTSPTVDREHTIHEKSTPRVFTPPAASVLVITHSIKQCTQMLTYQSGTTR